MCFWFLNVFFVHYYNYILAIAAMATTIQRAILLPPLFLLLLLVHVHGEQPLQGSCFAFAAPALWSHRLPAASASGRTLHARLQLLLLFRSQDLCRLASAITPPSHLLCLS